ncbi:hypothetical protein EDD15DRAFT_2156344 [Pisolithus albus]|nr:hypothetical protein EDD15DRAFT_2156344 [Pisolithus albus]
MYRKPVRIVSEATTLRWHLEATHRAEYLKWAAENDFTSMLPRDTKQRREDSAALSTQSSLNAHLVQRVPMVRYSDAGFHDAAVQWVIETDQASHLSFEPVHALQHPAFEKMISIASKATNGVDIPTWKQTRQKIIDLFKTNLRNLRKHLQVLP